MAPRVIYSYARISLLRGFFFFFYICIFSNRGENLFYVRDTNVYTDVDGSRQPAAERAKKIVWADRGNSNFSHSFGRTNDGANTRCDEVLSYFRPALATNFFVNVYEDVSARVRSEQHVSTYYIPSDYELARFEIEEKDCCPVGERGQYGAPRVRIALVSVKIIPR